MKKYFIATLSKTYRITIPKQIRKLSKLDNEGIVLFQMENGEVKLIGIPSSDNDRPAGCLDKHAQKHADLKKISRKH